jgi:hypothetical protein
LESPGASFLEEDPRALFSYRRRQKKVKRFLRVFEAILDFIDDNQKKCTNMWSFYNQLRHLTGLPAIYFLLAPGSFWWQMMYKAF